MDEKNVRAICSVAHSTKKNTGSGKGFIGEKGIGFKSVSFFHAYVDQFTDLHPLL